MMAAITALRTQMQTLVENQQQQRGGGGRFGPPRAAIWGNQPSTGGGRGFDIDCLYCGRLGHPMMQCELYAHDQAANGSFYHMRSGTLKVYNQFVEIPAGASPAAAVALHRGNRFVPMPGPPTPNEPKGAPQTSTNMMSVVSAARPTEKVQVGLSRAEPRIEEWKSED